MRGEGGDEDRKRLLLARSEIIYGSRAICIYYDGV
jgi:hypothetical protein